jgi:SAM-dependent methyltransferase
MESRVSEFDAYAESYFETLRENQGALGRDIDYYVQQKVGAIRREIRSVPQTILDYGCGIGRNVEFLRRAFPHSRITGTDVSGKSLDVARELNPEVEFLSLDRLLGEKRGFDLIVVTCVLHHVPESERAACLKCIRYLAAQDGEVFIFEHNPYNPVTRRLVSTCPFDQGAQLLVLRELTTILRKERFRILKQRYSLFFPARLKILAPLERFFAWLPLGGQFYVHAKVDPHDRNDA